MTVYGMTPLRRLAPGSYESTDGLYSIERIARNTWVLRMLTGVVGACDTKLSCECVLARHRAFRNGMLSRADYAREVRPWLK